MHVDGKTFPATDLNKKSALDRLKVDIEVGTTTSPIRGGWFLLYISNEKHWNMSIIAKKTFVAIAHLKTCSALEL